MFIASGLVSLTTYGLCLWWWARAQNGIRSVSLWIPIAGAAAMALPWAVLEGAPIGGFEAVVAAVAVVLGLTQGILAKVDLVIAS